MKTNMSVNFNRCIPIFIFIGRALVIYFMGCTTSDLTNTPSSSFDWTVLRTDHGGDHPLDGFLDVSQILADFRIWYNYTERTLKMDVKSDLQIDMGSSTQLANTAGAFIENLLYLENGYLLENKDPSINFNSSYPVDVTSFLIGLDNAQNNSANDMGITIKKGDLNTSFYNKWAVSIINDNAVYSYVYDVVESQKKLYNSVALTYTVMHELGHSRGLNNGNFDSPCCPNNSSTNCVMKEFNYTNGEYLGHLIYCSRHGNIFQNCLKSKILYIYDANCASPYGCQ